MEIDQKKHLSALPLIGKPTEEKISATNTITHSVRFVPWISAGIQCFAVSPEGDVALSRIDGTLEIWRNSTVFGVLYLPQASMCQSLAFRQDGRLFGCSLDCNITEFNIHNLHQLYTVDTNTPVWKIQISNEGKHLACGCEDGSIKIFLILENSEFHNQDKKGVVLDSVIWIQQDSRIISLQWNESDSVIYAGFAGYVAAIDSKKRRLTEKAQLSRYAHQKVWCWALLYLSSQNCLVTGDSNGKVIFWDTRYLTILSEFQASPTDILALTSNADGSRVWATGVSPEIHSFRGLKTKDWIYEGKVGGFSQLDIRQITFFNNVVMMASMTGDFVRAACPQSHLTLESVLQQKLRTEASLSVAHSAKILLYHSKDMLYLYQLGKAVTPSNNPIIIKENRVSSEMSSIEIPTVRKSPITEGPSFLAQMQLAIPYTRIWASAISQDAKFVAYSDGCCVKVLRFQIFPTPRLAKMKKLNALLSGFGNVSRIAFSPPSQNLMLLVCRGEIYPIDLENVVQLSPIMAHVSETKVQRTVNPNELRPFIFRVNFNQEGSLFATGDRSGGLNVFSYKSRQIKLLKSFFLPDLTDFSFSPNNTSIALLYGNRVTISNLKDLESAPELDVCVEIPKIKKFVGHQILFLSNLLFVIMSETKHLLSCEISGKTRKLVQFQDLLAVDWIQLPNQERELVFVEKPLSVGHPPSYEKKSYK